MRVTSAQRPPATRRSPMLHSCSVEGCSTIVFGRGPCLEHDNPRVPLADQLLAGAVAAAQKEQVDAEAATRPAAGSTAPN